MQREARKKSKINGVKKLLKRSAQNCTLVDCTLVENKFGVFSPAQHAQ